MFRGATALLVTIATLVATAQAIIEASPSEPHIDVQNENCDCMSACLYVCVRRTVN